MLRDHTGTYQGDGKSTGKVIANPAIICFNPDISSGLSAPNPVTSSGLSAPNPPKGGLIQLLPEMDYRLIVNMLLIIDKIRINPPLGAQGGKKKIN
jgi:hypothetical protein